MNVNRTSAPVLRLPYITLQTRIPSGSNIDHVLDAYSEVMNDAERKIHTALLRGCQWTGDIAVSLYKELGISAKLMESAYRARQAKVKSATELAKLHVSELDDKISSKQNQITDKERKLDKSGQLRDRLADRLLKAEERVSRLKLKLEAASAAKQSKALQSYKSALGEFHALRAKLEKHLAGIPRLQHAVHQHRRKLYILQHCRKRAWARLESSSICFGSRDLFKKQFHLQENGYSSHEEWLKDWRQARSSTFQIDGDAARESGNAFARLSKNDDDKFALELRLPEKLHHLAFRSEKVSNQIIHSVHLNNLEFKHNAHLLSEALANDQAISVRFHRDDKSWRIMVIFERNVPDLKWDDRCGCIGVDVNVGFLSVARADRHGNVVETFDIPMVTYGKSQGQSKGVVLQAVTKLTSYAVEKGLPIVCEDLDFSQKKRALNGDNPRYARMLSSFAYSTFQTGLASACARHDLFLKQVNPAFTSLIGRVNFASRYGLSVHRAAAFAIARRGMNLREEVPQSFKDSRSLRLPLNDAHHVTLELPERKDTATGNSDGTRHVWSVWSRINRHVRGALAAHRPSGRKPRSVKGWKHPRQIDVISVVCRRRRTVSGADTKSLDPRVGLLETSEDNLQADTTRARKRSTSPASQTRFNHL